MWNILIRINQNCSQLWSKFSLCGLSMSVYALTFFQILCIYTKVHHKRRPKISTTCWEMFMFREAILILCNVLLFLTLSLTLLFVWIDCCAFVCIVQRCVAVDPSHVHPHVSPLRPYMVLRWSHMVHMVYYCSSCTVPHSRQWCLSSNNT